jgi:membrane protease YdiL (CAAX protease family)
MNAKTREPRSALVGWAMIVVGLVAALALLLGGQELAARIPVESLAGGITLFYALLFVPLLVLALILGLIERRRTYRAGRAPLGWLVAGLALGAGGVLTCALYVALNGTLQPATHDPVPGWFVGLGLGIYAVQVLAEEAVFRGWLLPALEERTGSALAVLLSAAGFSLFHMIGGEVGAISLINLMLGGMWFALLAQRSGGIVAPFAAHYAWNVTEDIGLGLVPNPGVAEFGALFDHDMVGAPLWGGAEEGLNASIAMTVVLVALLLPLLPSFARPSRARA